MDAEDELVAISGMTMTGGNPGPGFLGGALYSDSGAGEAPDLTLADVVVTGNQAEGSGAVWGEDANFRIVNSVFSNNESTNYNGGALYLRPEDPGGLVIENSTITGNSAELYGGGVYIDQAAYDIVITGTTISNNRASFGGGVYMDQADADLRLVNSTISGNQAESGGGAMWVDPRADHTVSIRNSTLSGNSAYYTGGIFLEDESADNGSVAISSSILANNTRDSAASYENADLGQDNSSLGTLAAGFTLIESGGGVIDNGDSSLTLEESPGGSNLLGIDPQLGPLADNGGPTQTHAPSVGSPVIDAGVANGLGTDQRGAPRTFDAVNVNNAAGGDGTDIGSVELLPGGRLSLAQCKGATENVLFAPGTPIVGTNANDVIVGTDQKDQISSAKGKDKVCAQGANDAVKAGSGKDNVTGQGGKDRLKGNGGNDKLQGKAGRDTLKGGGGKDVLKGGGGKDKLRGGPGKDVLKGGAGKDSERQ
jgi:Ca2+-binding RTX toxin-like protein